MEKGHTVLVPRHMCDLAVRIYCARNALLHRHCHPRQQHRQLQQHNVNFLATNDNLPLATPTKQQPNITTNPPNSHCHFQQYHYHRDITSAEQPSQPHRQQPKQASYPLTFSPLRATEQDFVSKLILADLKDKNKPAKFEFDLRGTAEEPLAEGHRVVRCSARERVEQDFTLKNATGKGKRNNRSTSVIYIVQQKGSTENAMVQEEYSYYPYQRMIVHEDVNVFWGVHD